MAGITETLSAFSDKLKLFNQAGMTERQVQETEGQQLQRQIFDREERFKETVVATYKIYKAPFEAMGTLSDRAKVMDRDERALYRAYCLFAGAMKLNESCGESYATETDIFPDTDTTFINKVELSTTLTQKAAYTSGGQFVYLMMWLFFEKNCQEYMPVMIEKENGWNLTFVHADNYSFENRDKEIFEIVKSEFYSK